MNTKHNFLKFDFPSHNSVDVNKFSRLKFRVCERERVAAQYYKYIISKVYDCFALSYRKIYMQCRKIFIFTCWLYNYCRSTSTLVHINIHTITFCDNTENDNACKTRICFLVCVWVGVGVWWFSLIIEIRIISCSCSLLCSPKNI